MIDPEIRADAPVLWTWQRLMERTQAVMCRDYYQLRQKLEEIYKRAVIESAEMDVMALKELRLKMSAHIRNCETCQGTMRWVKGEAR